MIRQWRIAVVFCLVVASLMCSRNLIAESNPPDEVSFPCEQLFTYGFWGSEPRQYDLGFEGLLREMCRLSMNCLIAGPRLYEGELDLNRLQQELDLCQQYGVYLMPLTGTDEARLRILAEKFGNHPAILGWYIQDEPSPEFLDEFLKCKYLLEELAPKQPAFCLFYRPDSVRRFAPHQPVMLTDHYPLAYMHNGTTLGMHFGVRGGIFSLTEDFVLADGMSRFNMWNNYGMIEWMDLCQTIGGFSRRHWITLQAFESGNGHEVRWRAPSAPELRLQTWLSIAGGVSGINYFRYATMADEFGNSLPMPHGEGTPMLEEISRLGETVMAIAPVLHDSYPITPITANTTFRPSNDPGNGMEIRQLHSRSRDNIDYLVVVNYDLRESSSIRVNIHSPLLRNRPIYDLENLCPVEMLNYPGATCVDVELPPGGGRILCLACLSDYESVRSSILEAKSRNTIRNLRPDLDLAAKSHLDIKKAETLLGECEDLLAEGKSAEAWNACGAYRLALERAMREDRTFFEVKDSLEAIKRILGDLSRSGSPEWAQLAVPYRGLLGRFWDGDCKKIHRAVLDLREITEHLAMAVEQGSDAAEILLLSEADMAKIEKVAKSE